jgi:hypothetical protein
MPKIVPQYIPELHRPVNLAPKPAEPFHWEDVPWNTLLTIGAIVFVGAMAVGFYHARRPG